MRLPYYDRISNFIRHDERVILYLVIVLVVGFVGLTAAVLVVPAEVLDYEFSEEVQEDQSPLLDGLMHVVSWPGNGLAPGLIPAGVALLFFLYGARREAIFTLLTLLSGAVIYGIKLLINRPRPSADLIRVIEDAQFQSFPSGHVTFYVTFFGFVIYLMYRSAWIAEWFRWGVSVLCLMLIFSVPFSRMYLGAHWFTDVLGGFLVGLLCLIGLSWWYARSHWPAAKDTQL